jgi:hypothetical protein
MLEPKKRQNIFLHLEGGLGNQLFQYAAARALAVQLGADLYIDPSTGFSFNNRYRRRPELPGFLFNDKNMSLNQRIPFIILRCFPLKRFSAVKRVFHTVFPYFYFEHSFEYTPAPVALDFYPNIWMFGYWQSECYFKQQEKVIRSELCPPIPLATRFRRLGERMRRRNSVAVGIRLYEETDKPEAHCRDGKLKSPSEVSAAIERLQSMYENLYFYVFCTHKSAFISELQLPCNTMVLTPDMGYTDARDTLWLLSQCRHHVLTNSSFFWWGAWLSSSHYASSNQVILAADNFMNRDSLCSNWLPF